MQSNSSAINHFATFLWQTYKGDRTYLPRLLHPDITFFYKKNSYTSSTILFWYVLTTETKTTNGNKKNTAHFWKATEIFKFDVRYSMPKYGKISTLKIIFFSFRLYIKHFEILSLLLIPNMSYFKEIWILLLESHFHGIALLFPLISSENHRLMISG